MANLQKQIENLNNAIGLQLPQDTLHAFAASIADMKEKKIENHSLKKGMQLPRFTLKSIKGTDIDSDSLLGEYDKIILAFFRGSWCPYCNLELKALQESLVKIENEKAKLIAISPQRPEYSQSAADDNKITFDILFDENNALAKQLGISFRLQDFVIPHYQQLGIDLKEYNGNDENILPIPAVFVVDKDYNVIYTFVDANYMNRVDTDELIRKL